MKGETPISANTTYGPASTMPTWVASIHTLDEYEGRTGEPLSLRKHLYAHANPVTGWDPSGYCCSLTEVAYVGALLVGVGYLAYSATPDGRRANELLGELMIQIVWNVVIEPIMEGWYSVFAQGKPNKAVKDACRQKGIRDVNHFSDYYHERKRKNGRRGKDNNQWRVILDIADEYLEEFWA